LQNKSQDKSHSDHIERRSRVNLTDIVDVAIGLAAILAGWQVIFWLKLYPQSIFPSPTTTLNTFLRLIQAGTLPIDAYTTGYRLVGGFALVMVIGMAVGVLMVKFKRFGRTMASFSLGLQAFPSIAWVPFAILIVGLNDYGIIFVIVMSSAFSVMLSTYSGLRNIPPIYLKAASNMGAHRITLLTNVMLPASMPSLITGMRQAWSFSWHAVIGAEMVMGTVSGLGFALIYGWDFLRMDVVIASMITVFIIGFVVDRLIFYRLERSVRSKWGLAS